MTHVLHMIWNPSEGFDLGFFMIRYYSLMFVIAFALGFYLMKKIYIREGETIEKLDSLFIYMIFGVLLGARLGHVFFYDWDYYKNNLLEILLPFRFQPEFHFTGFTGLASHGAAIAVILVMIYYSKKVIHKPFLWIMDRITIPVAIGGFFVRLGNFFNSEIIGHESNFAFAIRFLRDKYSPQDAFAITNNPNINEAYHQIATDPQYAEFLDRVIAKHPTQLYEAFGYLIVFVIMYYMYWKTDARLKQGLLFGVFLILLWSTRFIVEFLKESQGGFESALGLFSTGQWLSIPFILVGFLLVYRANKATK